MASQIVRQRVRLTDKSQTDRLRVIRLIDRQADGDSYRQTERQKDRKIDRQAGTQASWQTGR
jgi:hypothetical protein